ncbi:MAG: hypothetical protein WCI27_02160 [Candidatus Omnitrophota bacterium]
MTKKFRVIAEEKGDFGVFWNKAKQFHDMMLHAEKTEKWAALGRSAVHCAISTSDALLVRYLGQRSAGDDHIQIRAIFSRLPIDGVEDQAVNLKRIIAKKNAIAYENREFRQSEALDISKKTERFYQ